MEEKVYQMSFSMDTCKYHPMGKLEENYYSVVCSECGLVVVDRIIEYDDLSLNPIQKSLFYQDCLANLNNLKDFNNFFYDSLQQKFLRNISEKANKIIVKLKLNKDIVKKTLLMFKQICVFDEIRICNKEAIIYSCIFIACKKESISFSFKDICATSTVTKKLIGKTFKKIMRVLIDKSNQLTVRDMIQQLCTKLGIGDEFVNRSLVIATKAVMLDIAANHSPISIVAAAILLAMSSAGQAIDIAETENQLNLSQASLKETFDYFSMHLNNLLPSRV